MSFIVLLFIGLNIETVSCLAKSPIPTVRVESFIFTTMLWAIFSLLMLIVGVKRNLSFFRAAGLILITVTFVKAIVDSFFACSCDYGCPLLFNLKFLSVAAVLFSIAYGVSLYADKEMPKTEFEKGVIPYMWTIFIILLFVELNVESTSACSVIWGIGEQKMTTVLSFLWVLYGFGLLVAGIIKKALPLRISALSLFGITLLKILFVDMQSIGQVYKILLLLGIGSILLVCAYFYRRYRKRLEDKNELGDGE